MDITPIVGPIKQLLQSRKFVLALTFIVLAIIVHFIPNITSLQQEVITNILLVGLGMPFLHLSVEDISKIWKGEAPTNLYVAVQEIATEILQQLVPVFMNQQPTTTTTTILQPTATTTTTTDGSMTTVTTAPTNPLPQSELGISIPATIQAGVPSQEASEALAELPPATKG